jgi:hypothetical protein
MILTSGRRRDRGQVVYHETAPSLKLLKQHYGCAKDDPRSKNETCDQCTENAKKVPRLVMVDQLWMWVLDESKPISYSVIAVTSCV